MIINSGGRRSRGVQISREVLGLEVPWLAVASSFVVASRSAGRPLRSTPAAEIPYSVDVGLSG